jgi:HAD superfamily hydrolase (TIGR01549 family)
MGGGIDIVFLDIGGVLYDDTIYARAWERALREAGAAFDDAAFDAEYARARADQRGSFRRRLTDRFLGVDADVERVERIAARYWSYPPTAVHDDVRPTLELLRGRYRLGIVANQPSEVRSAMHRDGLETFFEIWAVSDDLGVRKPDPRLFEMALEVARSEPDQAVMVGDRLDYDVRPAKAAGMRAVWMLRGEAPDEPTAEQLAEADGAVPSMVELPQLLASWSA